MAAKLSKEVTDSLKSCLFVLSAFITEGAYVAEKMLGLTQTHLEDADEPPGYYAVLIALARTIKAALDRVVSADVKLYAAMALESRLRKQQQETGQELAFKIVALRRTVIGQYVDPDLQILGLQALDARDVATVMRRSELIGEMFRRDDDGAPSELVVSALGKPRFEDPTNVWRFADQVRADADKLSDLTDEINKTSRRIDQARQDKHDALRAYKKVFLRGTRVFEDMCRLVDADELADRVRPSTTRPGRTEEPPPDDSGDPLELSKELSLRLAESAEDVVAPTSEA